MAVRSVTVFPLVVPPKKKENLLDKLFSGFSLAFMML
jgi:hypothetical protein